MRHVTAEAVGGEASCSSFMHSLIHTDTTHVNLRGYNPDSLQLWSVIGLFEHSL